MVANEITSSVQRKGIRTVIGAAIVAAALASGTASADDLTVIDNTMDLSQSDGLQHDAKVTADPAVTDNKSLTTYNTVTISDSVSQFTGNTTVNSGTTTLEKAYFSKDATVYIGKNGTLEMLNYFPSLNCSTNAGSQYLAGQIARAGLGKTNAEHASDAIKNVLSGVATGLLDTGSFVSGLVGARGLSKTIAEGSRAIQNVSEILGSDVEKAQQAWYESEQAEAKAKAQAQFEQDIVNGMDPTSAAAKREATLWGNTIANGFRTGNIVKDAFQGIGSVGSDIVLTGGRSALLNRKLPTSLTSET